MEQARFAIKIAKFTRQFRNFIKRKLTKTSFFCMMPNLVISYDLDVLLFCEDNTDSCFLYLQLPELTSVQPKRGENPLVHLALQNVGMLTGAGIMLLIAIYEDDIKLPHFEP